MFIRVGGIPGVGKSSIIDVVVAAGKRLDLSVERVHGADLLVELAGVKSLVELRKLPEDVREALRPEMYRLMYERDREDPEVIRLRDAHYTIKEPGRFVRCPLQEGDREQMGAMVVIVAKPEIILVRRKIDINREDRIQVLGSVIEEQQKEIEEARRQAASLGHRLRVIDNSGDLRHSCLELVQAIPDLVIRNKLEGYFGIAGEIEKR